MVMYGESSPKNKHSVSLLFQCYINSSVLQNIKCFVHTMDIYGVHHKTHAASTNIVIKISLFGLTLVSLNRKLFCVTLPHQLSWLLV